MSLFFPQVVIRARARTWRKSRDSRRLCETFLFSEQNPVHLGRLVVLPPSILSIAAAALHSTPISMPLSSFPLGFFHPILLDNGWSALLRTYPLDADAEPGSRSIYLILSSSYFSLYSTLYPSLSLLFPFLLLLLPFPYFSYPFRFFRTVFSALSDLRHHRVKTKATLLTEGEWIGEESTNKRTDVRSTDRPSNQPTDCELEDRKDQIEED